MVTLDLCKPEVNRLLVCKLRDELAPWFFFSDAVFYRLIIKAHAERHPPGHVDMLVSVRHGHPAGSATPAGQGGEEHPGVSTS